MISKLQNAAIVVLPLEESFMIHTPPTPHASNPTHSNLTVFVALVLPCDEYEAKASLS